MASEDAHEQEQRLREPYEGFLFFMKKRDPDFVRRSIETLVRSVYPSRFPKLDE